MEPFKISMESLPVEITHIRFLAFIGVYLFTMIFYIECFKIVDLGICVMYQSILITSLCLYRLQI